MPPFILRITKYPSYRGSPNTLQKVTAEAGPREDSGQGAGLAPHTATFVRGCDRVDRAAGRSDTWHGYTTTLPQRLHKGEGAPAQQSSGEHKGVFMGFNPYCQLLKLDDFHQHIPLLCQGLHALNWKETTTAAPITAPVRTCHPVPRRT